MRLPLQIGLKQIAGKDSRKDEKAQLAVGFEDREAICGVINLQPSDLPAEMRRYENQSADPAEARARPNHAERPRRQGGLIEDDEIDFRPFAELERRRAHPDDRVVLFVLMRVDRVVAERPE